MRATRSVIADLKSIPSLDGESGIHGTLLSLNAICAYALETVTAQTLSLAQGERVNGLAMQSRQLLDAVQSVLPLLFQATGRPAYLAPSQDVEELRNASGWMLRPDDDDRGTDASAWFALLGAVLNDKLNTVLMWAEEHQLGKPAALVRPLLDQLRWLQDSIEEAQAADRTSSKHHRPVGKFRTAP
ncbi:hypothetical protein [Rhizobium sp. FY34]|uniref:hypothetical protein n=1 Tax=Rhizobium sp. FY34 TaxID=2562309 RepID=UPI0010C0343C|nr:hypothetical protein [Rhizobium sp. FY34]